jgi:ribosomal protein S18 acetylase RimI-like enzyme
LHFNIIVLNEIKISTLNELVKIHQSSIPKSRFSSLPISVRRHIYVNFIANPFSKIYIARANDTKELIGAILIQDFQTAGRQSHSMSYLKFAPFILASAIRHPVIWLYQTFAETRLISRCRKSIYISAIYVSESHQGNGVGSSLIQRVKSEYPLAKFTVMTESENKHALNFYLCNHWKVEARYKKTILLSLEV